MATNKEEERRTALNKLNHGDDPRHEGDYYFKKAVIVALKFIVKHI